ncbi:hypothetical protein ScalyP_jg2755 [Parmales sp. scaly parma]|nr:hypothetical protein ScalyP_jg2755 [Parmales sp. scaly parma]
MDSPQQPEGDIVHVMGNEEETETDMREITSPADVPTSADAPASSSTLTTADGQSVPTSDVFGTSAMSVAELDRVIARCAIVVEQISKSSSLTEPPPLPSTLASLTIECSASESSILTFNDSPISSNGPIEISPDMIKSNASIHSSTQTKLTDLQEITQEYLKWVYRALLSTADTNSDFSSMTKEDATSHLSTNFHLSIGEDVIGYTPPSGSDTPYPDDTLKNVVISVMQAVGSSKNQAVLKERAESRKKAILEFEAKSRARMEEAKKAAGAGADASAGVGGKGQVEGGFLNKKKALGGAGGGKQGKFMGGVKMGMGLMKGVVFGKGKNFAIFFGAVGFMHVFGQELALPIPM